MNLDLATWSLDEVTQALNHSGYSADDIYTAEYVKTLNDKQEAIFRITYPDDYTDGGIGCGNVYIFIKDGKIQADY